MNPKFRKAMSHLASFFLVLVTNGKNGKPHVLTLQDMEQDSLQFDLAADSVEELFEWYQVAWDITQREMNKKYNKEQKVSVLWYRQYDNTV